MDLARNMQQVARRVIGLGPQSERFAEVPEVLSCSGLVRIFVNDRLRFARLLTRTRLEAIY